MPPADQEMPPADQEQQVSMLRKKPAAASKTVKKTAANQHGAEDPSGIVLGAKRDPTKARRFMKIFDSLPEPVQKEYNEAPPFNKL